MYFYFVESCADLYYDAFNFTSSEKLGRGTNCVCFRYGDSLGKIIGYLDIRALLARSPEGLRIIGNRGTWSMACVVACIARCKHLTSDLSIKYPNQSEIRR